MPERYDMLRDVRGVTWKPDAVLLLLDEANSHVIGAAMYINDRNGEMWEYFVPAASILFVGRKAEMTDDEPLTDEEIVEAIREARKAEPMDEEEELAPSDFPERTVGPGAGEEADIEVDLPQPRIT